MKVLIMHQTIAKYDAIGNDIRHMVGFLEKEYETFVYCDYMKTEGFSQLKKEELEDFFAEPENLVIYHHSVFWKEGEELLDKVKCKLIIRYHNVTPPEFFDGYSPAYSKLCGDGRRQTKRLAEKYPKAFWLCASRYNQEDIPQIPADRTDVIHPFHNLTAWDEIEPDEKVSEELADVKEPKVLFTGRVVPNKGHLDLIELAWNYRENYGENLHLYMVGKFDGSVASYTRQLERKVKHYGLEKVVHFIGEVTDESLAAYYKGCDYYVSFSNHEGFGVPFIEAQKWELPLLVKDKAAAKEVVGEEQLVLGEDVNLYSAAIFYLQENPEVREALKEAGTRNWTSRFDNEKAGGKLLELVRREW